MSSQFSTTILQSLLFSIYFIDDISCHENLRAFYFTAVWHDIQGFVFLITDVRNNLPNLGYLVNT